MGFWTIWFAIGICDAIYNLLYSIIAPHFGYGLPKSVVLELNKLGFGSESAMFMINILAVVISICAGPLIFPLSMWKLFKMFINKDYRDDRRVIGYTK